MNTLNIDRLGSDDWRMPRDVRLAGSKSHRTHSGRNCPTKRRYTDVEWASFLGSVEWFVAHDETAVSKASEG
jgi:hypothetical protein